MNPEKYKPKEEIRLTHFKGTKNTMYFTTRTNVALTKGAQESDLQEVGYFIKNCKDLKDSSIDSKCLIRSTSPYLDKEVDQGGKNAVLLENVTDFELLYYGDDVEKDPFSDWDSTGKGKKEHQNKFPSAVKIKLSIKSISNKEKEITMNLLTLVKNPNNKQLIE
ncbi:type II secretion system protein GspJ, partial [bacterium]|nr:type II secretion system protein GspJ [bacterium]